MSTNKKIALPLLLTIQLASALLAGFLSLVSGIVLGAVIGGNFGFFTWQGLTGYESGGLIIGFLAMCAGAWAGALLISVILRQPRNASLGLLPALLCFVVMLLVYSIPNASLITYSFLVITSVLSVVGLNWDTIRGKN